MAEHHQHDAEIMSLVEAVLARVPEEREEYLSLICADPVRRQEVRLCVEWEERMGDFLLEPILGDEPSPFTYRVDQLVAGRFRITRQVGRGGMGEVYEAADLELSGSVALKVIRPDLLDENDAIARFRREVRLARQVTHPNVCRIFDFGFDASVSPPRAFLTMELLEGETMQAVLKRNGRLPPEVVLPLLRQVAGGLGALHAQGIVHRDLKPANIILTGGGERAVICDFGLARGAQHGSADASITRQGLTAGTPDYMSPEQLLGGRASIQWDIYALGIILFEALTGRRPFDSGRRTRSGIQGLMMNPPDPREFAPDLPEGWSRAIAACLHFDPDKRPATADAIVEMVTAELPTTLVVQAQPKPRSKRIPALVGAGLLAAALTAGGLYWWSALARKAGSASTATPESPAIRQIAVLPFDVVSGGDRARSIADGLAEALTDALSTKEVASSGILPVPSSEIRRRRIFTAEEAVRVYGVAYVLTGITTGEGDRLHFTLRLVDGPSNRELGSAVLNYDPLKAKEGRNHILTEVARLLNIKRAQLDTDTQPDSRGAYAAYLEGRGLVARYDVRGNLPRAEEAFRKATQADPNLALAWVGLAEAAWRMVRAFGDPEKAKLALESAQKAVALDPGLAVAHSMLGAIYATVGREPEAISELKRAIELSPSNPEAPRELARVYSNLGREAEAEQAYKAAIRQRPTDWYSHVLLGLFYSDRERYSDAEHEFKAAVELAPANEVALRLLGLNYLFRGQYNEAVDRLLRSLKSQASDRTYLALGATYYYMHRFPEAVAAIETANDISPDRYEHWGNLGAYYKWVKGSEARAVPALRKAAEMAEKRLQVTPNSYVIRADLSEYWARLGEKKKAIEEIDRIPKTARKPVALVLATAYELLGERTAAIDVLCSNISNPVGLHRIRDDPELQGLWKDPTLRKRLAETLKTDAIQ